MSNAKPIPRFGKYEARAQWKHADGYFQSQPVAEFDVQPYLPRPPDVFGVFATYGGWIADSIDRAAAETHAGQLNGDHS